MTNIYKILSVLAILTIAAACKKDIDFNRDNATPTGVGYAPVSANPIQDITVNPPKALSTSKTSATAYAAGATFKTELTFFSQSPVKETTLSETIDAGPTAVVTTIPYASAFSKSKDSDTLLVTYTVPAVASGSIIKLDYKITNVNTLSVVRTVYVKVQ